MSKKYKVLINTGGGYFGVTIAAFLNYLGKDYDVAKNVNCISGTSIGGIITCALMSGCNNEDLLNGFIENGQKIFTKRWQNKLNILNLPFYDNKNLKTTIKNFVGDKTIKDTRQLYPNTSMFVPATNMTKNCLKVFDNVDGKDDKYSLLDVGLYTSAAEFYFPVLEDNGDAITDGGIRECCPIMTTAIGIKNKLGIDFKDMDVFVFGVGKSIDSIDQGCGKYEEIKDWGVLKWVTNFVVPDITNSNISMSKFWGENLGFNSFEFFNPIQIYGGMDDTSITEHILEQALMYKEMFLEKWEKFIQ